MTIITLIGWIGIALIVVAHALPVDQVLATIGASLIGIQLLLDRVSVFVWQMVRTTFVVFALIHLGVLS